MISESVVHDVARAKPGSKQRSRRIPPVLAVTLGDIRRTMHIAVLGKTGSGKSSLLRFLAKQDIEAGRGILYFDQHSGNALPFSSA